MVLQVERFMHLLLPVLNFFGQAPYSFQDDGTLFINKRKRVILGVSLLCFECYEIIDLATGIISLSERNEFMLQLYRVRYLCLILWHTGCAISTLAFTPKYLLRCHKYFLEFNKNLPLGTFSTWKVLTFFVTSTIFSISESFLYLAFRYSRIFADGSLLRSLSLTMITFYVCLSINAADVLFNVFTLLNQRCYAKVKQQLKRQMHPKTTFFPEWQQLSNQVNIQQIHDNFGKACDMRDSIQEAFSLHVFSNIFITFSDTIILFFVVFEGRTVKTLGAEYLYFLVFRSLSLFTKTIVTLYLCHGLSAQITEMAVIVHRLHRAAYNPVIKNQLMAFSQEILHRKGPLKALNMINLEFGLLTSMVGSMSTQIVILLQFNKSRSPTQ